MRPSAPRNRWLRLALCGPIAVALFGMLLQERAFAGQGSFEMVESLARDSLGREARREREDFLTLVAKARAISS